MSISTVIETISPKVAESFLSCNFDNRRVRQAHVRALAREMANGKWEMTHQGIAFSDAGRLLDGQHRLMAVMESGVTVQMLVTRGVPDESFKAIDQHARRSISDALRAERRLIEVCVLAHVIQSGQTRASPSQAEEWVPIVKDEHEMLMDATTTTKKYFSSAGMRLAAILTMKQRTDYREAVAQLYKNIVLCNLDELPPVGRSLIQQVVSGVAGRGARGGGRTTSLDALARGLVVFDPERRDQKRLLVRETARTILDTRKILTEIKEPK